MREICKHATQDASRDKGYTEKLRKLNQHRYAKVVTEIVAARLGQRWGLFTNKHLIEFNVGWRSRVLRKIKSVDTHGNQPQRGDSENPKHLQFNYQAERNIVYVRAGSTSSNTTHLRGKPTVTHYKPNNETEHGDHSSDQVTPKPSVTRTATTEVCILRRCWRLKT